MAGDVYGSGLSASSDAIPLIDAINNVPGRTLSPYATDINHSGVTNTQDILRLIDLLDGADAFDPWFGTWIGVLPCSL